MRAVRQTLHGSGGLHTGRVLVDIHTSEVIASDQELLVVNDWTVRPIAVVDVASILA